MESPMETNVTMQKLSISVRQIGFDHYSPILTILIYHHRPMIFHMSLPIGWLMEKRGGWNKAPSQQQDQQVNDAADGIPVTGPSTYSYQKDIKLLQNGNSRMMLIDGYYGIICDNIWII